MTTEEVKIGEQTYQIEVRPITIVVPSAQMAMGPRIEYPKRVELDMQATTYHAERVQKLHIDFYEAWHVFMSNANPAGPDLGPISPDELRKMGSGVLHLMGLIDMTLKFSDMGVSVVWKYPESCMHPGWQVALGDLALYFSRKYGDR